MRQLKELAERVAQQKAELAKYADNDPERYEAMREWCRPLRARRNTPPGFLRLDEVFRGQPVRQSKPGNIEPAYLEHTLQLPCLPVLAACLLVEPHRTQHSSLHIQSEVRGACVPCLHAGEAIHVAKDSSNRWLGRAKCVASPAHTCMGQLAE